MLQNLLLFTPYVALIVGVLHLAGLHFFNEDRAKVYSRIARFWLIVSLFFAIIFYAQNPLEAFFNSNSYSILFILVLNILIYHILGLSVSWFSSQNRTGGWFDILLLCATLFMSLLIMAENLFALFICYAALGLINYKLLQINYEKKPILSVANLIGVLIFVLFAGSVGYFYYLLHGSLSYDVIKEYLWENNQSFSLFFAVICLILPFFYALGIAPLHIAIEDKLSKSVLPVSHYFAIVLPLAVWGGFIKLNVMLYTVYANTLTSAYLCFALFSVFFGAIGANARINLQRIYAYSSFYHFGLVLLLLSLGHKHTDFAGFIYLVTYLLSLNGAYLVFYSLKSHGEYLVSITGVVGLAETKPYASGALSISLFSLIGMPPLIGFLGLFNLSYEMIKAEYFMSLGIIFVFLLLLFKAYLGIIKTAYFEHKVRVFDTVNKWVLTYMLLNILMIILLLFNPYHLIERLKDMFYVVFL